MSSEFRTLEMSGADPALRSALNEYLAYQHAKLIRQTLTRKLVLFVFGIGVLSFGLHVLPIAALVTSIFVAAGMFVVACTHESKARRRLTQQTNGRHST